MVTQQKNLHLIQLLRGIACMLVVLMHTSVNFLEAFKQPYLYGIFTFGGNGVDIFFVLSGFIITYAHLQQIGNPSKCVVFLKRRFIRIYPIYWMIITVFLVMNLSLPSFYKTQFDTSIGNLLKTYLLLPRHVMFNAVSWSLTNEIFFYLLFSLAFIIRNKKYSLLVALAYLIILVVLALTGTDMSAYNDYAGVIFSPMSIEFLMGIAAALLVSKISSKWVFPLLITGIIWFITAAILYNNNISIVGKGVNPGLDRVLLFGLPSFLIILSVVKMELHYKTRVRNIFLHLGDASYSIYLIHLPIVVAFFRIFARFNINNYFVLLLFSAFVLVITCFIGIVIYQKIEKPLIKKLNKKLIKQS